MKLGRKERTFNPKIMHMSAILAAKKLAPVPASVDWTKGITSWGMMNNDVLGCCTCAAVYHARQVWTANTITEQTETNNCVVKLYEAACGYNPNDPNTDNGGIEQNVLTYLLNNGAPLSNGSVDKITAFVEVDPRNIDDVKRTIADFGIAYIGFTVPKSIMPDDGNTPTLWEYEPNNSESLGGHAVICPGYNNVGPFVISWGSVYQMTWEFFSKFTDEVYAIVSPDWFTATGIDPLGMSVGELESLMSAIRA